jgi:hypothetical protein
MAGDRMRRATGSGDEQVNERGFSAWLRFDKKAGIIDLDFWVLSERHMFRIQLRT